MKAIVFDTTGHIAGIVPDSAIEPCRNPFFVPEGDHRWQACVLAGVRIDRLGKGIDPRFAGRYFGEVLTAVHPSGGNGDVEWSRDGALLTGPAAPAAGFAALAERMVPLVAQASADMTLKTGDLVLVSMDNTRDIAPGDTVTVDSDGCPRMTYKIR